MVRNYVLKGTDLTVGRTVHREGVVSLDEEIAALHPNLLTPLMPTTMRPMTENEAERFAERGEEGAMTVAASFTPPPPPATDKKTKSRREKR